MIRFLRLRLQTKAEPTPRKGRGPGTVADGGASAMETLSRALTVLIVAAPPLKNDTIVGPVAVKGMVNCVHVSTWVAGSVGLK